MDIRLGLAGNFRVSPLVSAVRIGLLGALAALTSAQAMAACNTPAADGATVTCTGLPTLITAPLINFSSNHNNLKVNIGVGDGLNALVGGTALLVTGTGTTITNNGVINPSILGALGLATSGLKVANGTGSSVLLNNNGTIRGTTGGLLALLTNLDGLAVNIQNGVGGTTTINNTGVIGSTQLLSVIGVPQDADALVLAAWGGGQVNMTNTASGLINGRMAFATAAGGNTFTNAGQLVGSLSMGAGGGNTFTSIVGSSLSAGTGSAPVLAGPAGTGISFGATGTVDGGAGGNNLLVLNNAIGGGSGTAGSGAINSSQYLNFNNLLVNSGTWTLNGAVVSTRATLNGGLTLFNHAAAFGSGVLSANGGAIQATVSGLTLNNQIGLGPAGLQVQGANDLGLAGAISGTGSLIKSGAGGLTLSGTNTYSGGTQLNGGKVVVGSDSAFGVGPVAIGGASILQSSAAYTVANAISLNNSNSLTVNGTGNLTLGGPISGTGALVKNAGNTLTLNGNNSYSGGTTLNSGSLVVGSDTALGAGVLNVLGSSTLDSNVGVRLINAINLGANLAIAGTNALTLNGVISGAGGLIKNGPANLTLGASNLFTGASSLNGGSLTLATSSALGTGALNTANDTTLDASTAVVLSNALNLTGNLNLGGSADMTFNGLVAGAGGLTKNGAANLTLNGANSFASGLILNGGALTVGHNAALGAGALSVNGVATLTNTTASTLANNIALNANLTLSGSNALTLSGIISGTGQLIKAGAQDLTLNGVNLYTGGTVVSGANLTLGNDRALGTGKLAVTGNTTLKNSVGMALDNAITLGANLTLGDNANPLILNGVIDGSAGLIKSGTSSLTLNGNNTYLGPTQLAGGTLVLGSNTALGSNVLEASAGTTLDANTAVAIINGINLLGNLTVAGSQSMTLGGVISGTGGLIKNGPGDLSLNNLNSYFGNTQLNTGRLIIGASGALGLGTLMAADGTTLDSSVAVTLTNAINVLSGNLTIGGSADLALSGSVNGVGGLIKQGAGDLALSGSNLYQGTTTLNAGTLTLSNSNAISTGNLVVNGAAGLNSAGLVSLTNNVLLNAALTVGGAQNLTLDGAVTGGGSLVKSGSANLILNGVNTYSGGTLLNGGTLTLGSANALSSGTLTVGGAATLDNRLAFSLGNAIVLNDTLTLAGDNALVLGGSISGTGGLIKSGLSDLELMGNNTFSGAVSILSGSVTASGSGALGNTSGVDVAAGANLNLGSSLSLAGLTGAGGVQIASGSTLSLGGTGLSSTFAGNIGGSGGLTKVGLGTLNLTGLNSLTGATQVNGGTLNVAAGSSLGSATVGVGAGATLTGGGVLGGAVSIANNGHLALASGNQLTLGSLALSSASQLDVALGAPSTTALAVVSGTLILDGTLNVSDLGGFGVGVYRLFTYNLGALIDNGLIVGSAPVGFNLGDLVIQTGVGGQVNLQVTSGSVNLQYWDGTQVAPNGNIDGGSGIWNSAGSFWTNTNGTANTAWGSDFAVFQGTAGTVSVEGSQAFQGMQFLTSGYTLTAGTAGQLTAVNTSSGSTAIRVDPNVTATIEVDINGGATLNKLDTGTLVLSGDNSYTGGTLLNGGTLVVGSNTALGAGLLSAADNTTLSSNGPRTLLNNVLLKGLLNVGGTNTLTLDGVISGSGGLFKYGASNLSLGGSNTYLGPTALAAGGLILASNTALSGGVLNASGGTTLDTSTAVALDNAVVLGGDLGIGGSYSLTLNGVISGTGGLTKNGAAQLVLNGINTFTSGVTLNSGLLAVGDEGALGSGNLTVAGAATLSNTQALSLANNIVLNSDLSVTVDAANPFILGGVISGAGDLGKVGVGELVLAGANTFNGALNILAGSVTVQSQGALGNTSGVSVASGASLNLGTSTRLAALTGSGAVQLASGTSLSLDGGSFAGSLGGAGGLIKTGLGTLELSGINGFTGTTLVNGGTLNLTGSLTGSNVTVNSGATFTGSGSASAVSIANGGHLALSSGNVLTATSLSMNSGSFLDVSLGAPSLTRLMSVGNLTLDGTLNVSNAGGFGVGVYRLFDYSGSLTDLGLDLGALPSGFSLADLTVQTGALGQVNLVVTPAGGALQFWDGSQTLANNVVNGGAGTWNSASTNWTSENGTANTDWIGHFAVFMGSSGTVTVDGNQSFTGMQFMTPGYQLVAGAMGQLTAINGSGGTALIRVDPGVLATLNVGIGGSATLEKNDLGTLVLNRASTYSGGTLLNAGSLVVGHNTALGSGALIAASGTTLDANTAITLGNAVTLAGDLGIGGSTDLTLNGVINGAGQLSKNGNANLTLTGTNKYQGGTLLNAGTLTLGSAAALGTGALSVGGPAILDSTTALVLANNVNINDELSISGNHNLTLSGLLAGTGTLTKNGSADLTLSASNTFSGVFNVLGGQLITQGVGALGNNASVNVGLGGSLNLGSSASLAELTGLGATTIGNGATLTLALDASSLNNTFAGSLGGAGQFTKTGTGTLNLTGSNGLTGATIVDEGTLNVSGTLASSTVAVNNGAILTGTGNLSGAVSVNGGGHLAVGTGNTLSLGSLALGSGAVIDASLGAPVAGGGTQLIEVDNDLTLDGTLNVSNAGGFGIGVYRLINYGGSLSNLGLDIGSFPAGFNLGDLQVQVSVGGQVNLVVGNGTQLQFWDGSQLSADGVVNGGSGIWNASSSNWTTANGTQNLSWTDNFAVFQGTAGTVTVDGNQTFSGMQFLTSGYALATGAAGQLTAVNGSNGYNAIRVDPNVVATIGVGIGGSATLAKLDAGTLVLNSANTYTGGTLLNGGKLVVGHNQALGTGTLISGDNTQLDANVAVSLANNVSLGGALTVAGSNALTLDGIVSGSGQLIKSGNANLTLNRVNSYQGGTVLNAGRLTLGNAAALGGGALTVNGTAQLANVGAMVLNNDIAISGALDLVSAQNLTLNGVLSGAGTLTHSGSSTLRLAGTNTFSGLFDMLNGELFTLSTGALGSNASVNLGIGTQLILNYSASLGTLTGLGTALINSGTLLTLGTDNTDSNFAGTLNGLGQLLKTGTGTLTLSGINGQSGATTVRAGTLNVTGALNSTTVAVRNGATLTGNGTLSGTLSLDNGARLDLSSANRLTVSRLVMNAASILDVALGAPSLTSLLSVGNGGLALNGLLNITDAGGFGTGIYRLIDYAGGTPGGPGLVINSVPTGYNLGDLLLQVGSGQVNVVVAASSVVMRFWNGTHAVPDGSVNGGNGTWASGATNWSNANGTTALTWGDDFAVFQGAPGTVTVAGNQAFNGMQFTSNGYTLASGVAGQLSAVNGSNGFATIRVDPGISATIDTDITGNAVLNKRDSGTLILNGANSYSGGTLLNGGSLVLGNNSALGSGALSAANGTTLDNNKALNVGNDLLLNGALSVAGSNALTLTGILSGNGSLLKNGNSALTLAGNNTYTGATTVNGGTLNVSGTLASGPVAINNGATLTGGGTLDGAVTVASGGHLAVSSGQTLSTGNLVLGSGAVIDAGLGAPVAGGGQALIHVAGNLTLDGTLNVTDIGGFGTGIYRLIDYTGGLTDNGLVLGTLPFGVLPGDMQVQTAVGSQVNVLVGSSSGNVQFWDGSQTTGNGSIQGGTSTWNAAGTNWTSADGLLNSQWSAGFAVFQGGAGTVTVDGAQSVSGLQFVSSGYNVVGGAAGELVLANGSGGNTAIRVDSGATATLGVALTGAGTLAKLDSGTLVLNGANTYSGGTLLNGGSLIVGNNSALGSGTLTTANGTTLDSNTAVSLSNATVLNGALTLGGSNALTLAGIISGSGALVKNGNGTLLLSGANTYTGGTVLNGGSTLGDSNSLVGAILNNAALTFAQTSNGTYSGNLTGTGTLTKTGTGVLLLTGNNGLTGNAQVNAGSLLVNGVLNSAHVLVASGATLGGSGTLGGAVQLDNGATLKAGSATTALSLGSLDLAAGSLLDFNLGLPGGSTTVIDVAGDLVLDGTLNISDAGRFGPGVYQLFRYGGSLTDNGLSYGVLPGGILPADLTLQTAVANQLNLVMQSSPGQLQFWNGSQTTADGSISGGSGIWGNGSNWTDASGNQSLNFNGQFAVFAGASGGTVTVAGPQSFTGLQFLDSGYSLVAGANGSLAPVNGAGGELAAVRVNAGALTQISAPMVGSGGIEKLDAGTLLLTGANTYTGGTTVSGGILAGDTNSLQGAILNNATLMFLQNFNGVMRGVLSGTGTLLKQGAGSLLLTGTNPFSGTVQVNEGVLEIGNADNLGASIAGQVTVANGAGLTGTGSVASLTNSGVVQAGNPTGNLTVLGNFVNTAAGQVNVLLGRASQLVVNGTADLAGTLNILALAPYSGDTQVALLTAAGGITGTFTTVNGIDTPFLNTALSYTGTQVNLQVQRNQVTFADVATTPNQTAVATALGAGMGAAGGSLQNSIIGMNRSAALAAFDSLSGEIHASTVSAILEDSRYLREAVNARMRQPNCNRNDDPRTGLAPADNRLSSAGCQGETVGWMQALGTWGDMGGDAGTAQLDRNLSGFILGADAQIAEPWRLGVAAGYTRSDLDAQARRSDARVDSYHLASYLNYQLDAFAARLGAGYSWHDIETKRDVSVGAYNDRLKAHYDARSAQVFGEIGYAIKVGSVALEPFAGLSYVNYQSDASHEKGGEGRLNVDAQQDITFSTFGLRAAQRIVLGNGSAFTPRASLGWRHAFGDIKPDADLSFVDGGAAFSIQGAPIARDSALVEAGIDLQIGTHGKLGLGYSGQLSSDNKDHAMTASFVFDF